MSSAPKKSRPGKDKSPAKDKAASSSDSTTGPRADARVISPGRYVLFFGIAIVGCAVDLLTKQVMFAWRGLPRANNEWWIVEGYVGIETAVNRGALFGMAPGYWWLFATLSVLAAGGILIWLFVYSAARDRWLTIALGCVTAGILGNLYDRLGFWDSTGLPQEFAHGVRDWILFRYKHYTWPNFNVADSLLVTGAIMLVVHALLWRDDKKRTATKLAA